LPQLYNVFETANGQALVLEWLPGENLYDYTAGKGKAAREDPHSPHARFRALPVRLILEALDTIYDAHLSIAALGFIAVDFYDGCILYDFERARTYLFDLDEYRPGPFTNESERLPGSKRFMAPEEFQRGARIDLVTNVFTLGRTALQLLGDGTPDAGGWRGSQAMLAVAARATDPQRERRYPDVRDFVEQWRKVVREDQLLKFNHRRISKHD
jgi:serine/threonine-protein kinase